MADPFTVSGIDLSGVFGTAGNAARAFLLHHPPITFLHNFFAGDGRNGLTVMVGDVELDIWPWPGDPALCDTKNAELGLSVPLVTLPA